MSYRNVEDLAIPGNKKITGGMTEEQHKDKEDAAVMTEGEHFAEILE